MGGTAKSFGAFTLLSFASITAIGAGTAAPAFAQEARRNYEIPAQPLASALIEFSRQSDLVVTASSRLTRGKSAPAVRGSYVPRQALEKLLEGSGLRGRTGRNGGIVVERANETRSSTLPNSVPDAQISLQDSADDAVEIVVTGSRLGALSKEGPIPVISFDRDRIEELGTSSVSDLLKYLPQQPFSFRESTIGQTQAAQLRGLAVGTTLVLINGRRTVTAGLMASNGGAFDLNTIPLAAVERVEVLPGGASAVYGADAVGGVINLILKSTIDRPVFDFRYGTADGGADERRASFSTGYASDRFRTSLILDYFDRNLLLGSERDPWRDRDFRRFGGADTRVTFANPGNICRSGPGNLPGLPTPCAAVPGGSTGVGLTPADFLATAGVQNKTSANSRDSSIIPAATRYSAVGTAEYDIGSHTIFAEFIYSHLDGLVTRTAPMLQRRLVPASNAFNPFGVPVLADFQLEAIGRGEDRSSIDTLRAVVGLKGKLGSWKYELSALGTRDWSSNTTVNVFLDNAAVAAALASSNPLTALNVFQDGPGASPEILAGLLRPAVTDTASSQAAQLAGFVSGALFALPGGTLDAVFGAEWRVEKLAANSPSAGISLDSSLANRTSVSLFSELRAPLVSPAMDIPGVERLTLTAAARYDHYSDFGSTVNPQVALEWSPVRTLLLRASYGTSFRAPALPAVYQPAFSTPSPPFPDPARGNALTVFEVIQGGNLDLAPETSEYSNFGLVWSPPVAGNVRMEIDYWWISQNDRLQVVNGPTLLANEALFPGRIVRDPPSAADTAAGFPGTLRILDGRWLNFGSVETSGIDFRVTSAFRSPIGRFAPSLAVTWVDKFEDALLPGAPVVQRAGSANVAGTIPRWRATGTMAWSHKGLGASLTGRFNSAVTDVTTANLPTGREIPAKILVDAQVSISPAEFASAPDWLRRYKIRAGVSNLFNESPDYSTLGSFGVDTSQVDPRQRFFYLNLSAAF